jgi:hypothetical protein
LLQFRKEFLIRKEVRSYVVRIDSHGGSDVGSRFLDGVGNEERKRRRQHGVKTRKKAYAPPMHD